ncbi:MAG: hypothetical protein KHY19_17890 [Coprobacillus cateniformis]|nr:hypothetical protein [Coprobacillus cateniformis]
MKKDLNENLSGVEANSVEIDKNKNGKTINKEDVKDSCKKEKKHSNAKTAIIVLGSVVLLVVAAVIATGGWNPFKSNEVSKEAKVAYENSVEKSEDILIKVQDMYIKDQGGTANDKEMIEDFEKSGYGPDGEFPNGFKVTDYGSEGKDGVLKEMDDVLNTLYEPQYGATIHILYMKNEDYAKEKYASMKGSYLGSYAKEYDTKNGKVAFAQSSDYQGGFVLVREGTVIYYGMSSENKNFNRLQKWFDLIGVDFKFTSVDEIFGK